jgi:hypothetical protein
MPARRSLGTVAFLLALAVGGCYEMAWYYPATGQGAHVSNGERLGIAHRLSDDTAGAQSFLVVSVREAYTADAGGGNNRTIVQTTFNVVNQAAAPAQVDLRKTALLIAGRAIPAKWVYRSGGLDKGARSEERAEIAPNTHARFDLFFDLEAYPARMSGLTIPPMTGGIPLEALREFDIAWVATWAGKESTGKVHFYRDYTGTVGGGWTAAGPLWGWGWWGYPGPVGGVIIRPYRPWTGPIQVPKIRL